MHSQDTQQLIFQNENSQSGYIFMIVRKSL